MQQAAEFFARLANAPDWEAVPVFLRNEAEETAQQAALLPAFKQVLVSQYLQAADQLQEQYGVHDSYLSAALVPLRARVRQTIVSLLSGETVTFSGYTLAGRLHGGVLRETLVPLGTEVLGAFNVRLRAETVLHQLLRLRPFPFGLCPVCHRVFVQPDRGKPRRFCSDVCKQKGIPSAVKRSGYALAWRHRVRDREVANARRILGTWPEERLRWLRLRRAFPRKSRRQLLYLIKQAQSKQGKED
jgi:hypothetical protein